MKIQNPSFNRFIAFSNLMIFSLKKNFVYSYRVLLLDEIKIKKIQQQLPSLKSSTRKEIMRRLMVATDYIYTFYDRKLSLEELAQACCLSKFHFLRLFKIAFGKTHLSVY